MSKIRVLADHVANQIAAGEVVERPSSVAKELVENSIDAGATRITVEIEAGGRRLLKVSDDGEGMVRDDAILAFERHATSKIRASEDLIAIGTLGFRGEALASIASVAKVELTTSTEDAAAATRVAIDGGKLRDVKDAGHPRGTTIAVRDLFFNVPARRKFLRAEATETFHLTNMVTHYALAHPEIAFTLVNNGRDVVRAVAAKDLRERAYQLFGAQFVENLLEVDGGNAQVARVTGFVSAPRDRRTNRDAQYFFVNDRYVRDRMIGRSLSEGYRSILPQCFYPAALLFVETPLEEVDVNVHPAKTEVRFRRSAAVADAIREAVREALARNDYVPQIPQTPQTQTPAQIPQTQTASAAVSFTPPQPRIEFVPPPQPLPAPVIPIPSGDEIARDIEDMIRVSSVKSVSPLPPVDSAAKLTSAVTPETLSTNIRPLGQLEESFIIATDDEGLLLIDQHVAHERVLFDKYRALEAERRTESQQLLVPETFDLTPAQAAVFDQLAPEFEVYGFDLMRLSGR
ncbi:MAG TPA: DNA mismatch repair endonuclease MutL, partial [Pyrinomonadaceae bacterium]|nr:DNA mismatch repair endonuclease MutL [Pyrinomonadaceae bacterium]